MASRCVRCAALGALVAMALVAGTADARSIAYNFSPGQGGNQGFGGELGNDFTVNVPIRVTEVGVFDDTKISQLVAKAERLPEGRGGTRNSLAFVQALSTQLLHELFIKRTNPPSTTEGTYHVIDDTRASS